MSNVETVQKLKVPFGDPRLEKIDLSDRAAFNDRQVGRGQSTPGSDLG
jgi:hypothetical protein